MQSTHSEIWYVKHDFSKYQPKWSGDYVRWFGPKNEGLPVVAHSKEEAIQLGAKALNLNPFYLTAEKDDDC